MCKGTPFFVVTVLSLCRFLPLGRRLCLASSDVKGKGVVHLILIFNNHKLKCKAGTSFHLSNSPSPVGYVFCWFVLGEMHRIKKRKSLSANMWSLMCWIHQWPFPMPFPNCLITCKLRIRTLGITNGPLRLIRQGASDVTVGEKVARDGIKTNHKQTLAFIF